MRILVLLSLLFCFSCVQSQEYSQKSAQLVGGCEGCEAIFEFDDLPDAVDTLPDWNGQGPKLKLTGTVYQSDGKSPASDVIIYMYHTDQSGVYPTRGDEKGWARRHGYLRGWVKTDKNGQYTFYTLRPATYPSRTEPAHVHPIILEPNGKYYWVKATYFDDDPLVTDEDRSEKNPRCGSPNVIKLEQEGDILIAERDFILGKNIPGY